MARGEASQVKVHYQGKDEDFIVFLDSQEDYKKWLSDKSVPLAQVVASFKVFITHKHGAQGTLDAASKATLENEFQSSDDETVIKKILQEGTIQESQFGERQGPKNDSQGPMVAH